jgi:hypothetical protein
MIRKIKVRTSEFYEWNVRVAHVQYIMDLHGTPFLPNHFKFPPFRILLKIIRRQRRNNYDFRRLRDSEIKIQMSMCSQFIMRCNAE